MLRILLVLILFQLAWADRVKVTFEASPPVDSVILEGETLRPDPNGIFELPLVNGKVLIAKDADGSHSARIPLNFSQDMQELKIPVRWATDYRPLLFVLFLSPLPVAWWLRRRSGQAGQEAAQLEQQQAAVLEADPNYPLVGQTLGGYRLEAPLGQGGMATVYRGRGSDGVAVAVKVISTETENIEFRTRFEREIKVSHTLKHPNVVEVLSWGQDEQRVFLVLELIDGKSMRDLLPPEGLPVARALEWSESICSALEYAHQKGVVHRDLKPDNVMVTAGGVVKLMDFGLARDHEVQTVTMTGQALGTPNYMPPEQVLEKSTKATLNPRSDQYSLAVTVYELFSGGLPFNGENAVAVIGKHLYEQPESLVQRKPELPVRLEVVIFRALAKDPQQRFDSVADFRQAMRSALS